MSALRTNPPLGTLAGDIDPGTLGGDRVLTEKRVTAATITAVAAKLDVGDFVDALRGIGSGELVGFDDQRDNIVYQVLTALADSDVEPFLFQFEKPKAEG